jgi:tetratricopeptide (TPR) repeat protein
MTEETVSTTQTITDIRQQVKELIDRSNHNDSIIREGEYCRSADFLEQFGEEQIQRLFQIYAENELAILPGLLADECETLLLKYYRTKELISLQYAVAFGSLIAYHVELDVHNPHRGVLLSVFARAILCQWRASRSDDRLLDDSIHYCRKAIDLGPVQDVRRALHYNDLGEQLTARYSQRHEVADFTEAEACFEQASTLRPAGRPVFFFQWAKLVRARDKFEKEDKAEMLRRYILKLKEAVKSETMEFKNTEYRVSISCIWWNLGCAIWERYELTQKPQDLDTAIEVLKHARTAPRHDSRDRFRVCKDLGRVIALRFGHKGSSEDGNAAVTMFKEALQITPDSLLAMQGLGNHLCVFANYTGSDDMLNEAAVILDKAYFATEKPGDYLCNARAQMLMQRFMRFSKIEDIDKAIELYQSLIDSSSEREEEEEALHVGYLTKLCHCFLLRFEALEQQDDLEGAHAAIERAISSVNFITSSVETKADCFHAQGKISIARYRTNNQIEHVDQAITQYQMSLASLTKSEINAYLQHLDLGLAYTLLFETTLLVNDLSESIRHFNAALDALKVSRDKTTNAASLVVKHGLANALTRQFELTHKHEDIDKAILCYEECVQSAAKRTMQYITRVNNLAHAYQLRFELTGQYTDLKQSQAVLLEVVSWELDLKPNSRCNMHNNLGRAFLFSYIYCKEPSYLDNASEHFRIALASGCTLPTLLVSPSVNLSHVLRLKARQTSDSRYHVALLTQLKISLGYLGRMEDSSSGPIDGITFNLMEGILQGWMHARYDPASVYGTMYLTACQTLLPRFKKIQGSVVARFYIFAAIAQHVVAKQPASARDMIHKAAKMLPKAIMLGFDRRDILSNLGHFVDLPSFTILFSLEAGDSPAQALELFDKVRSIMWDHVLINPLTLDGREIEKFPALRGMLEQMQRPAVKARGSTPLAGEIDQMLVQQHEVFCQTVAYQQMLQDLRSDPKLEGFLHLPGDTSGLVEYSHEGPVIIVNYAVFRSDAIIVTKEGVDSLLLPLLTGVALETAREWYSEALCLMSTNLLAATQRMDQVLEWLWDAITEPILQHLGFLNAVSEDELPRTWWITTGQIGTFPLHAAGNPKKGPGCTVLERTVPSYINSLRGLGYTRSRRRTAQRNSNTRAYARLLLISMQTTPDMGDNARLPNALHEVTGIQSVFDDRGGKSKILESPNRDTALRYLGKTDYAHFACHGVSDGDDPACSALRLTDWKVKPLDVTCLLQQADLECQLVYLSACESASNKSKFRDEGLHLAGGFQMAGVPHVIASLWRVDDSLSVGIAQGFYKALGAMGMNFECGHSAKALRCAILEQRARGVPSVLWAAYVHLGP